MRKSIYLLSVVSALQGCADLDRLLESGPSFQDTKSRASALSNAGQCGEADAVVQKYMNAQGGDEWRERSNGLVMFAVIAGTCRKDRQKFINLLTLSARYGNPSAQRLLAEGGHAVPPADLVPREEERSAGPTPFEQMMIESMRPSPIYDTNCNRFGSTTNCTTNVR